MQQTEVLLTGKRVRMLRTVVPCLLLLHALIDPSLAQQQPSKGLQILVLQGEGATNHINRGRGEKPVVLVKTEDDRPVEGATVVFELPSSGAGGSFGKKQKSLTVVTSKDGRAEGRDFRPNTDPGQFMIQVTATYDGQTAAAKITQTNAVSTSAEASKRSRGKMAGVYILIIGVASLISTLAAL